MSLSPFNAANDIVDFPEPQTLITSTWSNNTNDLNILTGYTSSNQGGDPGMSTPTSSGMFYIDVYNAITSSLTAEVQLGLAYGNHLGSGSPDFTNDTGSLGIGASRVVYGQYRNLVFDNETDKFKFGDYTPEGIYIINVNRSRYKQKLAPGSLNLHLSSSGIHGTGSTGGSDWGGIVHLTDDSVSEGAIVGNANYQTFSGGGGAGALGGFYTIVSGSNGSRLGTTSNQITINNTSSCYGYFYPHAGLIILNGDAFSSSFGTQATNNQINNGDQNTVYDKPHQSFFNAVVGGGTFIVDTEEQINSKYYFVRAKNSEFNYTNNESFTDADNRILHSSMQFNPKTFITTVGLYNNAAELVAVAKLSQPVAKDFTKEALIRVKLDY